MIQLSLITFFVQVLAASHDVHRAYSSASYYDFQLIVNSPTLLWVYSTKHVVSSLLFSYSVAMGNVSGWLRRSPNVLYVMRQDAKVRG